MSDAPVEVERKFVVTDVPDLAGRRADRIRQGYVAVGAGGDELRVRDRGGRCVVTIKHGSGLVRGEDEVPISTELFEALWPLTDGRRVEKTRHVVPLGDLVAEVDVFAGALDGLVMAEVEFPSLDAARAFAPPPWFGDEVTEDERFRNQQLALRGRPE